MCPDSARRGGLRRLHRPPLPRGPPRAAPGRARLITGGGATGLLVAAGLVAGTVNGAAGGGTLVSFPALLATGLPALPANITSSVGIWPGYLSGVAGFRDVVAAQASRSAELAPFALAGAVIGSILLLTTPDKAFTAITPYLVLGACALFAAQPVIARLVSAEMTASDSHSPSRPRLAAAQGGILASSVYGGYFGAGLGVILLALLGLVLPDGMVRTNGLRTVLSLVASTGAATVFVIHGSIDWRDAALLAASSLVGGYIGARVARRLPPLVFRLLVISLGLATAVRLLVH
ncbi:MAG: sulfite exporter TauE/SafE family protein [Acidimicrobiales bacterium]